MSCWRSTCGVVSQVSRRRLSKQLKRLRQVLFGKLLITRPLLVWLLHKSFQNVSNRYKMHDGAARRVGVVGFTYKKRTKFPADPAIGMLRWSSDGGRSWSKEITPQEWFWKEEYEFAFPSPGCAPIRVRASAKRYSRNRSRELPLPPDRESVARSGSL